MPEAARRQFHFARSGKPEIGCWEIAYGGEAIAGFPVVGRRRGRRMGTGFSGRMRFDRNSEASDAETIDCEISGPGPPSDRDIVRWLESLLLTSGGFEAMKVLHLVNEDIDGPASRGGGTERNLSRGRMIASLKGVDSRIPPRSPGDGIVRIFGLAVVLISPRDGLLPVDEVENGIHHSRFRTLRELVVQTAETSNVRVIAATHGYDRVKGPAQAIPISEGMGRQLIRNQSNRGQNPGDTPNRGGSARCCARCGLSASPSSGLRAAFLLGIMYESIHGG